MESRYYHKTDYAGTYDDSDEHSYEEDISH